MSIQLQSSLRIEPGFGAGHPAAQQSPARPRPASPVRKRSAASLSHYVSRPLLHIFPMVFGGAVLAALIAGWSVRHEGHITPENGVGYWLGIIGATMMALLMLYPLRKRWRLLRSLGRVPGWFRVHMLLGILGPALILFHCNFSFGALNSTVALATMLVVVASGIAGRYLYAKVHNGLYGSKAEVAQITRDVQMLKSALGDVLPPEAERMFERMRDFEASVLRPRRGVIGSLGAFGSSVVRSRLLRARLLHQADRLISERARRHRWSWRERGRRRATVRRELALYFAAVNKAARFGIYERLLALWHLLHFPLFLLLFATTVVHIVAVHLY